MQVVIFYSKMLPRRLVGTALPLAKKAFAVNSPSVAVAARRLAHGPPADYKHPTMDEWPVPCGSWQEQYDNNQRKYNIHLLFGTGLFIVTLFTGIYSGALNMYYLAPDKPGNRPK